MAGIFDGVFEIHLVSLNSSWRLKLRSTKMDAPHPSKTCLSCVCISKRSDLSCAFCVPSRFSRLEMLNDTAWIANTPSKIHDGHKNGLPARKKLLQQPDWRQSPRQIHPFHNFQKLLRRTRQLIILIIHNI